MKATWISCQFVIALSLSVILSACFDSDKSINDVIKTEILRRSSPDNFIDAVLTQTYSKKTKTSVYNLFIVAAGKPAVGNSPFNATRLTGWDLNWFDKNELEIHFKTGEIHYFYNNKDVYVEPDSEKRTRIPIKLILKPVDWKCTLKPDCEPK
ncbi:MAG: hypothetical protein HQL65_12470 [Magnetococcales bacterium]|nr:hypothetical protein [Magnetococcales bacterium]MBF0155221.1 hypothetical protein [Magnetococcales bacterium]